MNPCPQCGSTNAQRERRPDGDTKCLECGHTTKSKHWDYGEPPFQTHAQFTGAQWQSLRAYMRHLKGSVPNCVHLSFVMDSVDPGAITLRWANAKGAAITIRCTYDAMCNLEQMQLTDFVVPGRLEEINESLGRML